MNYFLGWPWTVILLISASQVAMIIGVSHSFLAKWTVFICILVTIISSPVQWLLPCPLSFLRQPLTMLLKLTWNFWTKAILLPQQEEKGLEAHATTPCFVNFLTIFLLWNGKRNNFLIHRNRFFYVTYRSIFFIVLLFISAYKAWVISPPCPHPLPYHPLSPPSPPQYPA
jgi:hypothetical protein